MEHEGDVDTNYNWCSRNCLQKLGKGTGRIRNQKKNRDHPDISIVEIVQNIPYGPGDQRRLAVTETPVKDQLLMLV